MTSLVRQDSSQRSSPKAGLARPERAPSPGSLSGWGSINGKKPSGMSPLLINYISAMESVGVGLQCGWKQLTQNYPAAEQHSPLGSPRGSPRVSPRGNPPLSPSRRRILSQALSGSYARSADFERIYDSLGESDKSAFCRKLWNIVVSAMNTAPVKTSTIEQELGSMFLKGRRNRGFGRTFAAAGDGSFRLVTEEEMECDRNEDEDSQHFDNRECSLTMDPLLGKRHTSVFVEQTRRQSFGSENSIKRETTDDWVPLSIQRQDSTLSSNKGSRQNSLNTKFHRSQSTGLAELEQSQSGYLPSSMIPELLVEGVTAKDDHVASRFDSCASLKNHKVVETTTLSKGEDQDGNTTINQYAVVGDLGRGSYSKVKLVLHNDSGEPFALKIMNKSLLNKIKKYSGTAMSQARVELAIMKKIAHPRIVRLHEIIDDPIKNKMYLILDYIDGGQICDLSIEGTCDMVPPRKVAKYLRQIVSALQYLHRHNIIHRDIKPGNLLLDRQDNVYLCDFGVSSIMEGDDVIHDLEGTPYFLSPEICEGDSYVHGKVADIWALGVTVYILLCGVVPFNGDSKLDIMHRIQNDAVHIPITLDPVTKGLLKQMLNKSPKNRITLDALRDHEFISGHGERTSVQYEQPIIISRRDVLKAVSMGLNLNPCPSIVKVRAMKVIKKYCDDLRKRLRDKKKQARIPPPGLPRPPSKKESRVPAAINTNIQTESTSDDSGSSGECSDVDVCDTGNNFIISINDNEDGCNLDGGNNNNNNNNNDTDNSNTITININNNTNTNICNFGVDDKPELELSQNDFVVSPTSSESGSLCNESSSLMESPSLESTASLSPTPPHPEKPNLCSKRPSVIDLGSTSPIPSPPLLASKCGSPSICSRPKSRSVVADSSEKQISRSMSAGPLDKISASADFSGLLQRNQLLIEPRDLDPLRTPSPASPAWGSDVSREDDLRYLSRMSECDHDSPVRASSRPTTSPYFRHLEPIPLTAALPASRGSLRKLEPLQLNVSG